MYSYAYLQSVEVVSTRIVGLLAICIISILISIISFMVLNVCQNAEKVKYLPLPTDESYGSTLYSRRSVKADYTKNTSGYEFNATGRPSEVTLFSSLQEGENENPGLFLCGPSLMVKQLRAFLSMGKCNDINVYEEIFEV